MGVNASLRVTPTGPLTEKELRKLSWELCDRFGAASFWQDGNRQVLSIEDEDGKIEIRWLLRYYGPGYERGPFEFIFMVGFFLLYKLKLTELEYGGDGEYVKYTIESWLELAKYFLEHGHVDYSMGRGPNCETCEVPTRFRKSNPEEYGYDCPCGYEVTVPR